MIPHPRGWLVDGSLLVPPAGLEAGAIRYVDFAPGTPAALEILAGLPVPEDAEVTGVDPPRELTTREGEHAVLVRSTARQAGQPLERWLGVVYGDRFHTLLLGTARRPELAAELAATVEELLVGQRLYLGIRRRRYRHLLPPGWTPTLLHAFYEHWAPPDAGDDTRLVVHPAFPFAAGNGEALLEGHLGDAAVTAREPIRNAGGRDGLVGRWWAMTTAAGVHDFVLLGDDRYQYPLLMRSRPERRAVHLPLFSALVESVTAIPRPEVERGLEVKLADHWV